MKQPNRKFPIKIDGEDTEIVMSWALQQEIMKVIPSPQDIAGLLITDFELREYVARRMLTGKKVIKEESDLFDLFEHDIDADQLDELILWVTDHILYFFTNTAGQSLTLGKKYQDQMKTLTQSAQSQTGSPD